MEHKRTQGVEGVDFSSFALGRACFFTAAMAARADYGLILWDGSSQGSLRNARDLVARGRAVVIIRNTVAITVRKSSDFIAL